MYLLSIQKKDRRRPPSADWAARASDLAHASLDWPGRGLARGALDQNVRIPFDVEPERPPKVDVREVRRPDPPKPVLLDHRHA